LGLKVPLPALLDGVLFDGALLGLAVGDAALAITTELAPMKAPMAPPASVEAAAAAATTALVRFILSSALQLVPGRGPMSSRLEGAPEGELRED
jgi:hypothetical protein